VLVNAVFIWAAFKHTTLSLTSRAGRIEFDGAEFDETASSPKAGTQAEFDETHQ